MQQVASFRMTIALTAVLLFLQVTTAPTSAPTTEADLRRIVSDLQRQIVELKQQVSALKTENAELKAQLPKAGAAKTGHKNVDDYKRLKTGMSKAEALAIMGPPVTRMSEDNDLSVGEWCYGPGNDKPWVRLTFRSDVLIRVQFIND
jgi:cell division protein FtsB